MNRAIKHASLLCTFFFLAGCGRKEEPTTFYGEFADVATTSPAAYQKSYLMMDCCREWDDLCHFVNDLDCKLETEGSLGVSAAEGFEFYLYDENGGILNAKDVLTVVFHPTPDFWERAAGCDIGIYSVNGEFHEAQNKGNDISFHTTHDGIYVAVAFGTSDPWISNVEDCTGQCSTCSDDW